jgi:hypothetical protein
MWDEAGSEHNIINPIIEAYAERHDISYNEAIEEFAAMRQRMYQEHKAMIEANLNTRPRNRHRSSLLIEHIRSASDECLTERSMI